MIVVKIKGGLGNQLFEYAMARKLQLDLGQDQIVLDIARVNADELRNFELGNFCLYENTVILQDAERGWISRFQEDAAKKIVSYCIAGRPEYVAAAREKKLENFFGLFGIVQRDHFEGNHKICFLKFHKHIYINGWFQNAQIPMSIRDILISDLMGIGKIDEEVKTLGQTMAKTTSVCVHIRRGDYVNHPSFGGICTEQYYRDAMVKIADVVPHPVFYVFSDSIDEIKDWSFDYPIIYDEVSHNSYESLYLMSKCRHFIISNSTYSWWAQFLSQSRDKIVIAPNKWYSDGSGRGAGLYMDDWVLLDV